MYEIDVLPVGDGERSGDAVAARFTTPGGAAHVVIDAGFKESGEQLVDHVAKYYGTTTVDLAILTHPDGDHIGGMGEVVRGLDVRHLWLHDLAARGGASLDAADAVNDLMSVASDNGTAVAEAFAGASAFGGALQTLGPSEDYYEELVEDQLALVRSGGRGGVLSEARVLAQRFLSALPLEVPFTDGLGTSSRNNSSMVVMLELEGRRLLFAGDAGVPALDRAWDRVETSGLGAAAPSFCLIPHHGSRRNASSKLLDRIHGPTGQSSSKTAFVSVAKRADSKHPSPRVMNAHQRRGFNVMQTAGSSICHFSGQLNRVGWGPITPLAPMDESAEEEE